MKTRQGFVSNSSSSSFVVHANDVNKSQFVKLIELSNSHECFYDDNEYFIEFEEPRGFGYDTQNGIVMSNLEYYLIDQNIKYKKI